MFHCCQPLGKGVNIRRSLLAATFLAIIQHILKVYCTLLLLVFTDLCLFYTVHICIFNCLLYFSFESEDFILSSEAWNTKCL